MREIIVDIIVSVEGGEDAWTKALFAQEMQSGVFSAGAWIESALAHDAPREDYALNDLTMF